MIMAISKKSIIRCREKFQYKGISHMIQTACYLIEEDVNAAIAEFIYDYDDIELYNVMLFLLKENYNFEELKNFDYVKF